MEGLPKLPDDIDEKSATKKEEQAPEMGSLFTSLNPKADSKPSTSYSRELTRGRGKRIHLGPADCLQLADSQEGTLALTQPQAIKTSSRDPSLGLYPRSKCNHPQLPQLPSEGDASLSGSFIKASRLLPGASCSNINQPSKSAFAQCDASGTGLHAKFTSFSPSKSRKRTRKGLPVQNNTLLSYLKQAEPVKVKTDATELKSEAGVAKSDVNPNFESHTGGVSSHSSPLSSSSFSSTKPTKLYGSPLKKVAGSDTCFYLDTSQGKPQTTSQELRSQSQSKTAKNNVTKILFDAQAASNRNSHPPVKKLKQNEPRFNRDNKFLYSSDVILPSSSRQVKASTFGLLGSTDAELIELLEDDDEEFGAMALRDFTKDLPDEILEKILCQLPLSDLCLHVNHVCHRWNNIIKEPRFMPWKKRFHHLMNGDDMMKADMVQMLTDNHMTCVDQNLRGLFRFMQDFKPITAHNMISCLRHHSLYEAAADLIRERLPHCHRDGVPNPWVCICVLVFLAPDVKQVTETLDCLLGPASQCTTSEVLECFYCIASFLWMFKSTKYNDVWTGMHYKVYYALYLYENESVCTRGQLQRAFDHNRGQQSLDRYAAGDTSVRMTHEQLRICNYEVVQNDIVKIVAFAGTGKTTTLVRYTQLRPGLKFLLVVYNKSVATHAKTRFPHNVECRTGHSLAFMKVGRMYGAAGKLRSLRVGDVVEFLKGRKGESLFVQAKFVIDTIGAYMASADMDITTAHVPDSHVLENGEIKVNDHRTKMNLAEDAEKIWRKMKDIQDKTLPLTHDGYLKLYQLRKPRLPKYDVLLIDEAQDLTPAIADILLSQTQPKILVGDPHQQIYGFRGAVNAMNQVTDTKLFYLTQSFRFGPEIAFTAATCLEFLKGEKRKILVGNGIQGSILGDKVGQVAVICRSNFTVFSEAVKKCCFSDEDIKVAFAGGVDNFGFDMLEDIYTLLMASSVAEKKSKIKNGLIRKFVDQGFAELRKYAMKTSDTELMGKIHIVETFNTALPSHINKIRKKCINDLDLADMVFSTAHKAKGLEFSTVRVTDDFNVMPNAVIANLYRPNRQLEDEGNLLYVAVTRAKKRLILSPTLVRLLSCAGERFYTFTPSSQLQEGNTHLKCSGTDQMFKPTVITLVKQEYTRSDGVKVSGDVISPQWVSQEIPSLNHLLGPLEHNHHPELVEAL